MKNRKKVINIAAYRKIACQQRQAIDFLWKKVNNRKEIFLFQKQKYKGAQNYGKEKH